MSRQQPRAPKGTPEGGQWTSARSVSRGSATVQRGDYIDDPMAGEKPGVHTPAAAKRVISYLEKETGMQFEVHGSIGRGEESKNDIDILVVDPTRGMSAAEREEYSQKQWVDAMKAESEVWDRHMRGEISREQAMKEIYEPESNNDPVEVALNKIGFKRTRDMGFSGAVVSRFHNKETKHTIEVWAASGDDGSPESGPRMFSTDFNPETGEVLRTGTH